MIPIPAGVQVWLPTDFSWVRAHPDHLPRKPKWMKQARYKEAVEKSS
jgi:hypothetical protein